MKNNILALIAICFIAVSPVTAQGINFEHITLEEALTKAAAENKLVFIDFYTEWCGPCKKMEKFIFPLPEVGGFYNKNFISLKLDAEKEGSAVARQYGVTNYPTLLYLDTDGKVLLKDTAFNPKDEFITSGRRALESVNSKYSLANLQQAFPNKLQDEYFLKMYIKKMQEYGQVLHDGIDAWLRVQTEMAEDSEEMKDYLLKNARHLVVGGKGHQIYEQHLVTYLEKASPGEQRMLPRLNTLILNNTKKVARQRKDPQLMKAYIEAYKQMPENRIKKDELVASELSYYAMTNDDASYKLLTEKYLEGVLGEKSIGQIWEEDKKMYDKYKRAYDKDPVPQREIMLNASKEGLRASKVLREIHAKGLSYLSRLPSKKEYKHLEEWVKYGYKLKPDNCYMNDLQAAIYSTKGKPKKALRFKEKALKSWPRTDKKFIN